MKTCDIIIPIYNAFDCLAPCIDSVIKNTDLSNNRIILIDDKSTDGRVLPLLKKYADGKTIILLENETNAGFVKSVNKGMRYSKNDVLLLNSDTVVTNDYLSLMQTCAYSDENIATVTPLSNNATLVSVPNSYKVGNFVPNELPKGFTLEEFASLVKNASYNDNLEVPTGHGFCFFIKRTALNAVGFFDETAFGKGYGEENDFCYRCLDLGLKNVVCDAAYVYHKESKSFSEKRKKLCAQGEKVLQERYPHYLEKLSRFLESEKISYIGKNINFALSQTKKPNVLCIIHDWTNYKASTGGTTLHLWDLIQNLSSQFNFCVLYFEDGRYKTLSYGGSTGGGIPNIYPV